MKSDDCLAALRALADPSRHKIVRQLLAHSHTVNELAVALEIPQYNISKHLKVLREAGIMVSHREGKEVHCEIAPDSRTKLATGEWSLDLGCCSFQFEPAEQQ